MENTGTYNKEFFVKMVEESAQEELDKANAEKVLKHASKQSLAELFSSEGEEFYKSLLYIIGSIRMNKARDQKMQASLDELKEESLNLEDKTVKTPATIKLIAGKLLGLLKFTWDTAVVSVALVSRVTFNLLKNLGCALLDTGKYTVGEGKCAGDAIKDSWNRNLKN